MAISVTKTLTLKSFSLSPLTDLVSKGPTRRREMENADSGHMSKTVAASTLGVPLFRGGRRESQVLSLAVSSALKWKLCPDCDRLFRTTSSRCSLQQHRLLG